MIRRILRRLLGSGAVGITPRSPERPPVPPAPAPATVPDEPEEEPMIEVRTAELSTWRDDARPLVLLDIREVHEIRGGIVEGAWVCPMNLVPDQVRDLPRDATLVVYCAAGVRSYGVTHWLREQGFEDTWSLVGGAGAAVEAGYGWAPPPPEAVERAMRGLWTP